MLTRMKMATRLASHVAEPSHLGLDFDAWMASRDCIEDSIVRAMPDPEEATA